ncbi:hypothetical protein BJY04DRAFT_222809 [Aspergillus karnatakaensis]|uniref:uncharacterized protein n=1 Tax=Aspergillus karnatakaensis TaxID=1810916 RepID=UPI003CCDCD69
MDAEDIVSEFMEPIKAGIARLTPSQRTSLRNLINSRIQNLASGDPELSVQTREPPDQLFNDMLAEDEPIQNEPPSATEELLLKARINEKEHEIRQICMNIGNTTDMGALQQGEAVLALLKKNGAKKKDSTLYRTRQMLAEKINTMRRYQLELQALEKEKTRARRANSSERIGARHMVLTAVLAFQESRRAERARKAQRTQILQRDEDYDTEDRVSDGQSWYAERSRTA